MDIEDLQLRLVLNGYKNNVSAVDVKDRLLPYIQKWAGNNLIDCFLAGSTAKQTAVKGSADVDIFISISSKCTNTLKEIFDSLFNALRANGFNPRRQNVSIGINFEGILVDLVPGKKDLGNTNFHKLYKNKTGTWTQTNLVQQINTIVSSKRIEEIRLTKIWRNNKALDFPSYFLELSVIFALKQRKVGDLAANMMRVFEYLCKEFISVRIVDPTNSANILSNDISSKTKETIAQGACLSLRQTSWEQRLS